ncbi:MAG: KEOPS complex subunit Pcc1 [Candidatus Micrarchaeota archaeon]|nr:KEOPS complex subunit Pcc1 [Candidatus Micrarchaeota archaeon]
MAKLKCDLRIPFPSAALAKKAHDSLVQETEYRKRCAAQLKLSGNELILTIASEELAPFRATINSYLRLLNVYFSAEKIVSE